MLLGIYSDAHFSRASSIMTNQSNYRYSERLDMLIESFKWMYEVFQDNNVDMILNLGDLVSSDSLDAETSSALSEALSYSDNSIEEIHLIGNHERKSNDSSYNSISLLKNYPNIKLIDSSEIYTLTDSGKKLALGFISYTNDESSIDEFLESLSKKRVSKRLLFTHQMYNGCLPTSLVGGLDAEYIFNAYNISKIFNGHIHIGKQVGNYVQPGALVGMSFGDNYSEHKPGIILYDTVSDEINWIENPYAKLYYSIEGSSLVEIKSELDKLGESEKLVRLKVPLHLKESVSEYIKDNESKFKLSGYRVSVDPKSRPIIKDDEDSKSLAVSHESLIESLKSFIVGQDNLPYPAPDMLDYINSYLREDS